MKIAELKELNIQDIEKLSKKELLEVTKYAQRIARQRVTRLEQYKEETGIQPIAISKMDKNPFTRDVEKLRVNQLRKELKSSVSFIKNRASTITGAKKARAKLVKKLGIDESILTAEERKKQEQNIFEAYNKFIELNPALKEKYGSDVILRNAQKVANEKNDVATVTQITKGLEKGYATLEYAVNMKGIGRFI